MRHCSPSTSVVCLIAVLCFACSCNGNKSTEQTITSFPTTDTLELTLVSVQNDILLQPQAAFATDEYVVVFQRNAANVFCFFDRSDLSFVFSAGLMGRAVGEFILPDSRFFRATPQGFKMLDYNTIKHFEVQENKLNLISAEQLPTSNTINNLQVLSDTLFCYANSDPANVYEFALLNTNGDVRAISPYPEWKEGDPQQRIFTYLANVVSEQQSGRFMAFYAYFRRARLFNSDGTLLKEIFVDVPDCWTAQAAGSQQRSIAYGVVPITDQRYIYAMCLNKSRTDDTDRNSEIHVFSWEGDPIARWIVKQPVDIITLAPNGKTLYFIDSQNGAAIYWCAMPVL